jgi:hypothetical protein
MRYAWLLVTTLAASLSAHAVPTEITVRVLAKDAKFIGSSMGGVRVTITDAERRAARARRHRRRRRGYERI